MGSGVAFRTFHRPKEIGIRSSEAGDQALLDWVPATKTIGIVAGFAIMAIEVWPKRLELLCELVPRTKMIGLLVNPGTVSSRHIQEVQEAALANGVQLHILKAGSDVDLEIASPLSSNCKSAGLWSAPIRSSTAGASGS